MSDPLNMPFRYIDIFNTNAQTLKKYKRVPVNAAIHHSRPKPGVNLLHFDAIAGTPKHEVHVQITLCLGRLFEQLPIELAREIYQAAEAYHKTNTTQKEGTSE